MKCVVVAAVVQRDKFNGSRLCKGEELQGWWCSARCKFASRSGDRQLRYTRIWRSFSGSSRQSAPVAQLDRASGYEPEGRQFESVRAHHKNQWFTGCCRKNSPPIRLPGSNLPDEPRPCTSRSWRSPAKPEVRSPPEDQGPT